MPGATPAIIIDISKAFDRVCEPNKFKLYGISCSIFGLISSFLSNRQLHVVMDGKPSASDLFTLGFLKASFLIRLLSCFALIIFLMILLAILLPMLIILLFTPIVFGLLFVATA